jgi:hypothetical protein
MLYFARIGLGIYGASLRTKSKAFVITMSGQWKEPWRFAAGAEVDRFFWPVILTDRKTL